MLFFVFFFQAEDGIRDLTVTGVQTCALPISSDSGSSGAGRQLSVTGQASPGGGAPAPSGGGRSMLDTGFDVTLLRDVAIGDRSEERRVGKECRSRWSPYH